MPILNMKNVLLEWLKEKGLQFPSLPFFHPDDAHCVGSMISNCFSNQDVQSVNQDPFLNSNCNHCSTQRPNELLNLGLINNPLVKLK